MARPKNPNSTRGFASMDPAKRREIAAKGGSAVPSEKRAFSVNKSLARAAGKKGGEATPGSKRQSREKGI